MHVFDNVFKSNHQQHIWQVFSAVTFSSDMLTAKMLN